MHENPLDSYRPGGPSFNHLVSGKARKGATETTDMTKTAGIHRANNGLPEKGL